MNTLRSLLLLLLCSFAAGAGANSQVPLIFKGFRGLERDTISVPTPPVSLIEMRAIADPDSFALPEYIIGGEEQQRLSRVHDRLYYAYMLAHPRQIEYLAWILPPPPKLKATKNNTQVFLVYELPTTIDDGPAPVLIEDIGRINWLHNFDGGVQFSQSYLSPNWYQGGTNALTLLANLLWDVKLNEVYHPDLLFNNTISYKLGLYSTPQDQYHKYSVSQDLFQWNMKFGVKARKKWFYSLIAQFKTQILHSYAENSQERKASFLSPGELNLGLGMTYATTGMKGRLKFNASLSPLSYNLKTCIDPHVDPTQFSIPAGKKIFNQIGTNAELTSEWKLTDNIEWRARIFLFTDYKDFQGDWENTFSFSINRFLSTQIYAHLRYDTSTPSSANWRYWQLKEILSFGFRYAFSTK